MINNNDNIMPVAQNASANIDNLIQELKRLGIEFYIGNNGAVQSKCSKVISIEKLYTDPELIKQVKGGWFISDSTETYWIYVRISNGRIKEIIPITSIHINVYLIINYKQGSFDFIFLEYSTNAAHTDINSAIITYKNYSPKRIMKELKGTPYISEDGEKLKGALLYYLISRFVTTPTPNTILYIGKIQGWWMTPDYKYRFNSTNNFRKEIIEHLPLAVQCRENPIQSQTAPYENTKELLPMFEDNPPFQIMLLYRIASLCLFFFNEKGIKSDQLLVIHPNQNIPPELICAVLKNTRYDNLNMTPIGPNIKPLKFDIASINDGVLIAMDTFKADQYLKIEKGLNLLLNNLFGAIEDNTESHHVSVIISSYADLQISQNSRCVLEFDNYKTSYIPIQYRNVLRRSDAALVNIIESDYKKFSKIFYQHLSDAKNNIPDIIPKSKENTYILLITMLRTYNDLFSPLFSVDLENDITNWLAFQEKDARSLDDIICSEFADALNKKIDDGYFNLVLKEEVTPFDRGSHTMIVDPEERRVYIETEESFNIVKNDMNSISDTDKLTTALANENYLHVNVHNSKCHKLATIDSNDKPHQLYSHGIKYQLITPANKQRFSLIGKDIYLFERDEIPTENFLPLVKTVDGRYAGKMLIYDEEESNIYFGTGRTGSGKSWAIAQILPMLFMLGHIVVVFDVSGSYTKEKIVKRGMLPIDFVEHGIKFFNVGEKVGKIPVNPFSLKGFTSTQELFMYIHSIIRSCTGKLDDRQEKKLTSCIYDYIQTNIVSGEACTDISNDKFTEESSKECNNTTTDFKEIDIFELCGWLEKRGAVCRHIAEAVIPILNNIKAIGCEDKTWEELFSKNNKVIIINLGNEAGQRTHQLLDILVGSLLHWQMSCDSKFLSIAIDELKDQDFTLGSALNTIVTEGRKFHTALIGATQDYFNQGSSYLDSMKQANIKSYCRPGKSEDRVAQKLGYSNASTAGFNKFKAGDVIVEADFYNRELNMNTPTTIKGRVVDFVETPLYEKFKEKYLKPDVPPNYYGNTK